MVSLRLVTPWAVICQFPSEGKVTVVENAPVLSAPVPGSVITVPPFGGVSQREIDSPAVKPLLEKVMAAPLATGVNPEGAVPGATGALVTGAVVVPVVPTA